jgi:hypothetical protein
VRCQVEYEAECSSLGLSMKSFVLTSHVGASFEFVARNKTRRATLEY